MLYENLPGFEVEVHDGNLTLPAEPSLTQTVLIIAPTAVGGNAEEYLPEEYNPVILTGQADFTKKNLGAYEITNPMACLWKQAYDAGCRDIRAIPLKGTDPEDKYKNLHDIYSLLRDNIDADVIVLGGVYAGETAPGTTTIDTTIEKDFGAPILSKTGNPGKATAEIPDEAITGDGESKTFRILHSSIIGSSVVIKLAGESEPTTLLPEDYTVNEITGEITFKTAPLDKAALSVSYSYYLYSFAAQLAGFCDIVTATNTQVIGVMALAPAQDSNLQTIKNYIDTQGLQYYSESLQVVGGTELIFNLGGAVYQGTWQGAYAGFISLLPSSSSPTAKVIPGALLPAYRLSSPQILSLVNKHIVVPRVRNGRITVAEAITTAADTSDFVRLTTLRITHDVVNLVRDIAEPYIGEPNTLPRRSALDTQINSGLQKMVVRGALNDFRFHIKSTIADQIDGNMRINLDIVPVFETRRIMMSVAVKPMI